METSFYVDLDYTDPSKNVHFCDLLDAYFDKFAVGKEVSKSGVRHYQCWVYNSEDTNAYTNFIAKCKKDFELIGRATKDQRKQYGKIKGVIRDTDNMISYCVKDHNYFFKGLDEDYVIFRESESYQKEESRDDKFKIFIEACKKKMYTHPDTAPPLDGSISAYDDRLLNATIICETWFELYDTVIPRTMVNKVLLVLGLTTHEQLAHQLFYAYIGKNPLTDY